MKVEYNSVFPKEEDYNANIASVIVRDDSNKIVQEIGREIPIEMLSIQQADKICKNVHFLPRNILHSDVRQILLGFILGHNEGITAKALKQTIDKIWSLDFEDFKTGKVGIVIDKEDFYATY